MKRFSIKTHALENLRRIKANNPDFNSQFYYASNYIKTSKYTVLTFLPLNLFEQFQRLANFYFLCLLILQLIPAITSLTPITTALPLIGVLMITAIKDAYDDYQRFCSDSIVNNRSTQTIRDGCLLDDKWQSVHVGDVIRINSEQFIAADILLLSSSEPNGLCYIETAELDGETNLKCRTSFSETNELGQNNGLLGSFDGEIICENPNNVLNKFDGILIWRDKQYVLDNDNIILRGCVLRNTQWCYGVVIFAGKDTKLIQNSGVAHFKQTNIDRLLNFLIIGIVYFLLSMCFFCMIASGIWEYHIGKYFQTYLPWENFISSDAFLGALTISFLVFFSYTIVLNTVVPISLYVSVEMIRFVQSYLINNDVKMFDVKKREPAKARTTTLNDMLGQIEYIFSDKTGTLTQNIMTFNKCSINGKCYGDVIDPLTGQIIEINSRTKPVDFSFNAYYEPNFMFYDKSLLKAVEKNDVACHEFFRLLALCHTVMAVGNDNQLVYQAQSPDEGALVSAARNFGFVFHSRTPNSITVEVLGQLEMYELLCILDFNNVRKRMSVILRSQQNVIKLYCKGADQVIYERLRKNVDFDIKENTQEHLNKFAGEGLRTLCLAYRIIDETFFNEWFMRYRNMAIQNSLSGDRDELLNRCFDEIECDLILLGCTGIEDKLQDGVPQTIHSLSLAGIKIWVLTGDKQETAINIGYSCQLLTDDMADVFIIDAIDETEVCNQLQNIQSSIKLLNIKKLNNQQFSNNDIISQKNDSLDYKLSLNLEQNETITNESINQFAIVVNGHSLIHCLNRRLETVFFNVTELCKSVICCRVTPLQKALVVELIKKYKNCGTLAIGDGANDVSMIKAAHIGVGISGQEGMQAVLASDYSISQFKYLERLLLIHGRWSYYRMCTFLRYFFYKNFAFTVCHFWFSFFCGFSAQTVFDPMFISVYNLFYTSLPVLALGIFDQDVNEKYSLCYPQLYRPGQLNLLFNKTEFLKTALLGCYTSLVLFFILYGAYYDAVSTEGQSLSNYMLLGSTMATILVIVNTVQIALNTTYWTLFNHLTIWGSLLCYFVMDYIYNYIIGGSYVGSLFKAMISVKFWFTLILTIVISIVPVLALRLYFIDVHPTLTDKVRLKQHYSQIRSKHTDSEIRTPSSIRASRVSRRSLRSGYAFAHHEGFGSLITSGKMHVNSSLSNLNSFLPSNKVNQMSRSKHIRSSISN